MRIVECEQGSVEWFQAKAGVPSASNFDKIVTTTGFASKQKVKYMYRLAGETITGMPEETYQNMAMARGIELEDEARMFYEITTSSTVEQVGFCIADEGFACSPDGLVGKDGLIEIKCPSMAVHVEYLLDGSLPKTYFQQVQGQMLVTGRRWCDFVSYYPAIKPLVVRVERNEEFLDKLKIELVSFVQELKEVANKIK
jgi:putative phage-type endonuclease